MRFRPYYQPMVLALSMPGLAHGLGLGDIRVDSRLGEPLSAQVSIVGATPEELSTLRAEVASADTFVRYRTQRPAFLASATIVVGEDPRGQPVLNIHSTQPFTEPLVDLLVDLRWGKEQLVRDYALLLDPVTSAPPASGGAAASSNNDDAGTAAMSSRATESSPAPAPDGTPAVPVSGAADPQARTEESKGNHRLVAHGPLSTVARRVHGYSAADQPRVMLALYQANPSAFAGNMNRLHRGALLRIPSRDEVMAVSSAEAQRQVQAQLIAWKSGRAPTALARAGTVVRATESMPQASASTGTEWPLVVSGMNHLDGRLQYLQQTLDEANRTIAVANARIGKLEQVAAGAAPAVREQARVQPASTSRWGVIPLALTLLGAVVFFGARRFWPIKARKPAPSGVERAEAAAPAVDPVVAEASADPPAMSSARTEAFVSASAGVEATQPMAVFAETGGEEESVTVTMETIQPDAVGTALDYNLADLNAPAEHLEMPGSLHEHVVVVERRKNVVTTLMAAIQRDPTRSDLRMKLLETLYANAAQNQRGFLEVVRSLEGHPDYLSAAQWQEVLAMGRDIAPGDALFSEQGEDDIADCA